MTKEEFELGEKDIFSFQCEKELNFKNPLEYILEVLNVSQLKLSLIIGVSEGTVNRWSASPSSIPQSMLNFFSLLEENKILRDELIKYQIFKSSLNDFLIGK